MPVGTRIGGRLVLLCLPVASLSCATEKGLVASSFHERFHCPDPQVRELGNDRWEAQGCGNIRHYQCRTDDAFVESKIICQEIQDELVAVALVQGMHGRAYGCNATDVRPLEGSLRIYQALGCGRPTLYACWTDANQLFCRRTPDETCSPHWCRVCTAVRTAAT